MIVQLQRQGVKDRKQDFESTQLTGEGNRKGISWPQAIFRILIGVSSLLGGRIGRCRAVRKSQCPWGLGCSVLAVYLFLMLALQVSLALLLERTTSFLVVTASARAWAPQRIICRKTLLALEAGVTAGLGQWLTPRTWEDLTGRCLNYSHLCTILHQGSRDRLGGTGFTQTGVMNMSLWRVGQDSGLTVQDKADNVRCTQRCQPSRLLIANWWVQVRLQCFLAYWF